MTQGAVNSKFFDIEIRHLHVTVIQRVAYFIF